MGGNPETGPFYVEGVMPGDTLANKFHRIRLNRDSADSGNRIVSGELKAGYYRDAKFDSEWKLDREAGVEMLAKPTDRLKNFKVKLQPMLSCVGVAPPANQSFRAGWLGSWGGNMDYNGIREGVTVYLPVYQEGALLFVGDGHALEGDGELNGDALGTSMNVAFTVDLIRGKSTQWPRFENDEYLMARASRARCRTRCNGLPPNWLDGWSGTISCRRMNRASFWEPRSGMRASSGSVTSLIYSGSAKAT